MTSLAICQLERELVEIVKHTVDDGRTTRLEITNEGVKSECKQFSTVARSAEKISKMRNAIKTKIKVTY